ncbi:glycine cleavage system transcriptional repressor [Gammaproteobacteria bacterium]
MKQWYMLTVVGQDRPGIVAQLTASLYEGGCNLGEASMIRLGGNFTIMLMVQFAGSIKLDATKPAPSPDLDGLVRPVADALGLHLHIYPIDGGLHQHREPDVRITVHGADRAGIVAQVTGALAKAGLDILDLESDVAGSEQKPIYVMNIEGHATQGVPALRTALAAVIGDGIEAHLELIQTLFG